MLMIVVTILLAVLYGLAWHNEPAKKPRSKSSSDQ